VPWQTRAVQRTQLSRLPELAIRDVALLHELLDSTPIAHVALLDAQGSVLVVPTAFVRDHERLLIHGSTGSGWMRRLASGAEVSVAVTAVDGIIVARSTFESSYRYRSAVLFGRFASVDNGDKEATLDLIVDRLIPGRAAEVRRPHRRELSATSVLSMPITEWSLKVSQGWPDDPPEEVATDTWAGVVPMRTAYGTPMAAPDVRPGIPIPPSVRRLVDDVPPDVATPAPEPS